MKFSDKLSLIIKRSKHTKKGFAINCGMNPNQIYNYLNGDQLPGMEFFRKMKKKYPWVNLDDLINDEKDICFNKDDNIEIDRGVEYDMKKGEEVGSVRSIAGKYGVSPYGEASDGLRDIFNSGEQVLISAIQANIRAFQLSARREHDNTQQARQIKALQVECDELKKRIDTLEKTCAQTSTPGPEGGTIDRKVM